MAIFFRIILPLLASILINFPVQAGDSYLPSAPCDFVGYETGAEGLIIGDEVCVKDSQANNLGKFTVNVDGQYGFLSIPADNEETSGKDGARQKEALSFYINGVEQKNSALWAEAGLQRVDLGQPKTALSVQITSPAAESAVGASPIVVSGSVSDPRAQVKLVLNNNDTFTPQVRSDGTFSQENVNLIDGTNTLSVSAEDPARNSASAQINVYLGWVLHLEDVPWYAREKSHYSGAAVCKMILDYLRGEDERTGKTQEALYKYGYALNMVENSGILEMDARAVDAVLGHFDKYDRPDNWYDQEDGGGNPYQGYNFGISAFDPGVNSLAFEEYLRDIAHWMAYPVTVEEWWLRGELVDRPNSPAAVPLRGSYGHWVAVNGVAASGNPAPNPHTNPFHIPEVKIYGFWLSDPAGDGIGKDVYVTAAEARKTCFLPLSSNDEYNGQYLQVAEPPKTPSKAKVEIAPEKVNRSGQKLVEIAQDIAGLQQHKYDAAKVVNLAAENGSISWQEIINSQALTDTEFRNAIEDSIARQFVRVKREDSGAAYYIIPFDKHIRGQFLTYAAITVDAETGAFKQASWVKEPVRFVPITQARAEELVCSMLDTRYSMSVSSELVWQPQGLSSSPFFPYWKVTTGREIFYVTQDGEITSLADKY